VIAGARPNLSIREFQALEELIADYQDFFFLKKRAVNMAQRKCTRGSILAKPALFASPLADYL